MGTVFNAGKITSESTTVFAELISFLEKNALKELAMKLKEGVDKAQQTEKIKVAFVGQFSSGKSSIISALTGNKAIKIGSDVTTDKSEIYEWGNFLLVDTPGLQNNETHDEIAEEAIKSSDLIVYCITSELFSKNTLNDFKTLAFEKGYKSKMVLLINKLNSEFTSDINMLIKTYEANLIKDVLPYQLDEIPYYFIDVKDYLDGTEDNDDELIEDSRFIGFIEFLNKYLIEKGLLCKLTTPILYAKQIIDEAFVDSSETQDEKAKRIALARLRRTVDRHKANASKNWDYIISDKTYDFLNQGFSMANRLGEEEIDLELEFNKLVDETQRDILDCLQAFVEECASVLCDDLDEILQSQVGRYLLTKTDGTGKGEFGFGGQKENHEDMRKFADKGGEVAGKLLANIKTEHLYKLVEKVGHKVFKIKFKPWGITKAAGKLSKALKAVGPAMEVISLLMDVKETVDESKAAKELMEAKKNVRNVVKQTGNEIRESFFLQKADFLSELYEPVFVEIDNINSEMTQNSNNAKEFNSDLCGYKNQLDKLFDLIVK